MSVGLAGMENVQKLIGNDDPLQAPMLRSPKGALSVAVPSDRWHTLDSPRHERDPNNLKLRINNYNVPYGDVRSSVYGDDRIRLAGSEAAQDFEEKLDALDRMQQRRIKPKHVKDDVMVELP